MTTKTETIHARVEPKLKSSTEAIFAQLGLTTADAVRLFLRQVDLHKGLPFEVRIPNKQSREALRDLKERRKLTKMTFSEFKSFLDE